MSNAGISSLVHILAKESKMKMEKVRALLQVHYNSGTLQLRYITSQVHYNCLPNVFSAVDTPMNTIEGQESIGFNSR